MQYRKVYVEVTAKFTTEGKIYPLFIKWEDGTAFEIDRILDIQNRASLKVGGVGVRYTVRINDQRAFLYLEENRWFVEGKT